MGLFDKFKTGLKKTRDFLTQGVKKIAFSMGRFDEDQLDELEMLLIQADMGVGCADEIMDNIKSAMQREGNDTEEFVLGVLKSEVVRILGEQKYLTIDDDRLNIILLVGVNGTGKTTTAGKLALRYKRAGKKVILAAADTFRAAAIDQLATWAERTDTELIAHAEGGDPAAVVYDAVDAAIGKKADVLLIDTAGRLHNKKNLMDELGKMRRILNKKAADANITTLLVIDATTGQNAVLQAQTFAEVSTVDSLCITKLDGNSKGGIAVGVAWQTNFPIVLAGLGEGAEDLVDFDPHIFAESLLPQTDEINSLVQ
ncbi:MAG: signal recognition particle-docking protein FtsY [Fastidiosipilaceae bacterium]|nr:signal recognition particle-docking protein FtsY [Clostridiaceae bacterium]